MTDGGDLGYALHPMPHRPKSVAPDADDEHIGLLTVWNPELKPDTIKAHVDILRGGSHVWWARIHKGRSTKSPNAAVHDYDPYRRLALDDDLVVFVTDYRSLHALRVTDVRTTERLDDDEVANTPEYSRGERALAWFKVVDIRAISHDSLEALDWMKRRIRPQIVGGDKPLKGTWGFDPYAALPFFYPIVVKGPAVEQLFSEQEIPAGRKRFADDDSVFAAPLVERAFDALSVTLGIDTWSGLADDAKFFLASTHIVHGQLGSEYLDVGPRITGLARALERELRDEILLPLHARRDLLPNRDELERVFQPKRAGTEFQARDVALGGIPIYLGRLRDWATGRGLNHLSRLGAPDWTQWLSRFSETRNAVIHAHAVDREALLKTYATFHDEVVGDSKRLGTVVGAKREVAGILA